MRKIMQFPLVWMVTGVILLGLSGFMTQKLFVDSQGILSIMLALAGGIVSIAIYWLVMKFMAGRKVQELQLRRAGTELILGTELASY